MTRPVGLVGFGKMGAAMVQSWQKSKILGAIDILDPHIAAQDLSYIEQARHFKDEDAFLSHAKDWDALILAIKPQTLDTLFGDAPALPPHLLVVSILAGKTLMDLSQKFGPEQPVIRAMPNTPASIGKGMSVAVAGRRVTAEQKEKVDALLSALGSLAWIKTEDDMDVITALSGSGPAYVFYMIECMARAGMAAGLDADFAMRLARQTVIGAAGLAEVEKDTPVDVLRGNVTSPNGTTAAGLSVLMDGTFQDVMRKTIAKAAARSKELSSS